ncbi:MAG: glycogen synthase GlgA [Candidatus Sumerlaeota bacterium]|nr:glycogen synthase GlgA [Candidatus Sumerlaeota bacterium]
MKILIVASEAHPYFKTGGLGDVAGALARALAASGHDVRIAIPGYRFLELNGSIPRIVMPEALVELDGIATPGSIECIPAEAPTYLVRCDRYFDRAGAYGEAIGSQWLDYPDNMERFAFFCMAVLWMLKGLDWRPDIIHCNDWQTALIPAILRSHRILAQDAFYRPIKTLFSIHNVAFQGRTAPIMLPTIGLGPQAFDAEGMEFHGAMNLLKGGILLSDGISTVSARYAEEIQTPELGCGLDIVLRRRKGQLTGILNGIDYTEWNPESDPHLPARYGAEDLSGKAVCKASLQREVGLPPDARTPLVGMVSRLSTQKGFELVDAALANLIEEGAQLVMLGAGEPRYHRMLEGMARRYPEQVRAHLTFDNGLAHRIEAGSDIFLMPSYYEPCGLNQMFSMRYGTPPVVRRTGGLADSVIPCSPAALAHGKATGFVFEAYEPRAMFEALRKALNLWRQSPQEWRRLMRAGMQRDFSWAAAAHKYEELYKKIIKHAKT